MNWETALSYIKNKSSDTQKFFTSVSSIDELGPTLVGMANHEGGTIIVGFDARNYHLLGCEHSIEWFEKINQFCNEPINFIINLTNKNNKTIVLITIPKSQQPVTYKNTYYIFENGNATENNMQQKAKPVYAIETPVVASPINQPAMTFEITLPEIQEPPRMEEQEIEQEDEISSTDHYEDYSPIEETPVQNILRSENNWEVQLTSLSAQTTPSITIEKESQTAPSTPLNKRQQGTLNYLENEKFIKNKKYRELFQVSHKTAHLELIALVKSGLITPTGAGRSTCYMRAKKAESQSF